jgi:hypothetical protein
MDFNDPCLPDEATVRQFIQIISEHAIRAINGNGSTGVLQLFRINPFDEKVAVPCRFQLDDVDHMVQTALTDAAAGHNVYIEARTVRNDLKGNKRGELEDTVWVLGLVVDSDADKGKGGNVTAKPSLAVETSPGNYHLWYLLDRAIPAMQAKTIGEALRKNVGSRPVDRSRSPIGAAYTLSTAENHRIGRLRRPARFRVRKPQGSLDRAVERSSAARVQGPEPGHPSLCGLFAFAETAGAFSAQRRSGGYGRQLWRIGARARAAGSGRQNP